MDKTPNSNNHINLYATDFQIKIFNYFNYLTKVLGIKMFQGNN
jgi:hypothetical protein